MKVNTYCTIDEAFSQIAKAKREYYQGFAVSDDTEKDVFVRLSQKSPDQKQRIISSLIGQRNKFADEIMKYLLYTKHTNEIEPTKRIREAVLKGEKLKLTREMINLDIILGKNKISEKVTVYRCGNPMDFGLPIETDDFIKTFFEEGKYFRIPIYPRTTLRKGFAKQYAKLCVKKEIKPILYKINLPKGTRGIYLDDMEGEDKGIKCWNEQEIMLERNRVYKFKKHTSHRYYEKIEIDRVPRWKVPFWEKIHNFGREFN